MENASTENDSRPLPPHRAQSRLTPFEKSLSNVPSPLVGEGRVRGQKVRQLFLERCLTDDGVDSAAGGDSSQGDLGQLSDLGILVLQAGLQRFGCIGCDWPQAAQRKDRQALDGDV